jgi:hypothetical protein
MAAWAVRARSALQDRIAQELRLPISDCHVTSGHRERLAHVRRGGGHGHWIEAPLARGRCPGAPRDPGKSPQSRSLAAHFEYGRHVPRGPPSGTGAEDCGVRSGSRERTRPVVTFVPYRASVSSLAKYRIRPSASRAAGTRPHEMSGGSAPTGGGSGEREGRPASTLQRSRRDCQGRRLPVSGRRDIACRHRHLCWTSVGAE